MIHTILRAVCSKDDQTDDRAFGADDVAGIGPMFRKLRSLMIADRGSPVKKMTIKTSVRQWTVAAAHDLRAETVRVSPSIRWRRADPAIHESGNGPVLAIFQPKLRCGVNGQRGENFEVGLIWLPRRESGLRPDGLRSRPIGGEFSVSRIRFPLPGR